MMSIKAEEMQENVETETGECEGRPSPLLPPAIETPPSENDEEFFVAPRTHDDSTVRLNTRGVSLLDPRGFLHQQESRSTEDSEPQLKIVDADSRIVKREESSPPDDSREPEDAVENFEPVEFRDTEGSGLGSTTYEADVRPPLLSVEEQKKEDLPDLDHNMNTDLYSYYSMIDGQIKAESPSLTFTPTSAGANQAQKSITKTNENEKEVGDDEVLLPSLNLNNDLYYYSMIDDNVENEHEPGREDTAEKGENKAKPDEETLTHEEQYHSLLKLSEKNDLYYSMMNPVGDEEEESFLQECESSDETKQQKDQHAHNEDNYGRKTINHETPTSLSSRRTTTAHHQYNSPSPPPLSITSSHTDLEHPHSTASHINHNNNSSDLGMYNTMNTSYSTSNIYYSEMLFQPVSYQNYPSEYNHHNHHHLRTPMSPISRPGSNTITTTSLKRPSSSSPSPVTSPSHHNMKKFPKLMTTPNHSPIPTTSNPETSATTEQQEQQSSITATNTTTTTVHHPFPINYDHYMTNSRKQRQANNAGNKGKQHHRKSDGEKNSETETTTETLPPLMNESSNSATTSSSTSASTSAAQRTYTYTGEAIPYPANTHFNNQTNNSMYQGNTTCSNNTNTNSDSSSSSRADDYTNVNHQHNSNIMYHPMYASTHSHHLQQFQQAQYQYSQYQPHNRYPHSQNNLASLEATKRLSCKCKKSQCLMLYCDCFQRGSFCNMFCSCLNCFNTQDHAGPDGRRTQARNECLRRNPNAFEQKKKVKAGVNGCACKNSKCLKKYCECYRNNILCTEKCRCRNCMNQGETPKDTGKDSSMQVQDIISNTNATA